MITKAENYLDMQFNNNAQLIATLINKWVKTNPDNKEFRAVQKAIIENTIYVATLHNNLLACKWVNSDYREQRNDALLELNELKEDIKEYEL